jgi:hypothetical protein
MAFFSSIKLYDSLVKQGDWCGFVKDIVPTPRVPSYGDFRKTGDGVSCSRVDCEMAGVVSGLFLFPEAVSKLSAFAFSFGATGKLQASTLSPLARFKKICNRERTYQRPEPRVSVMECGGRAQRRHRFRPHERHRTEENLRPHQSGAEVTALQTLARPTNAPTRREASGVRRVYRRFRPHDAPSNKGKSSSARKRRVPIAIGIPAAVQNLAELAASIPKSGYGFS